MIQTVYSCIQDQHELRLVLLAAVICTVSTAIGIDMLGRARRNDQAGLFRWLWAVGAGSVASTGIWATHFVGMLAYSFNLPVSFDMVATVTSLIVGWISCVTAFALVVGGTSRWRVIGAGLDIGCGVALLHYVGTYGLGIPYVIIWDPELIAVSVAAGCLFSTLAMAMFCYWKGLSSRLLAALVLSLGVVSLHFSGMAALSFLRDSALDVVAEAGSNSTIIVLVITGISAIAMLAFVTSVFDQVLARRNNEETRRLTDLTRKLEVALDEARAADKVKSEFLAVMSHEIRTPLTGMIGMIDLVCRSTDGAEQRKYASLARESADSLLTVINDVLDFSKLDSGNWEPESLDFDLARLVQSTVDGFRPAIGKKKVDLRLEMAGNTCRWFKGDPTRVRQILCNLISNAVKFTEVGFVEVAVRMGQLETAIELRFEVTDTGIGMSPEVRSRLFSPFVQADSSMSRRYGGSGLGLAISKRLCELMGGRIGAEDGPSGTGSRFWFTVICEAGVPTINEAKVPPLAPVGPLSILVAEDTQIIGSLIRRILTGAGHHVSIVTTGAHAVDAIKSNRFDVVLMDIQMPGMDGLAATREIRRLKLAQSTPIIALTANVLANERKRCIQAGMSEYVTKPIRPELLLAAIERCAIGIVRQSSESEPCGLDPASMMR